MDKKKNQVRFAAITLFFIFIEAVLFTVGLVSLAFKTEAAWIDVLWKISFGGLAATAVGYTAYAVITHIIGKKAASEEEVLNKELYITTMFLRILGCAAAFLNFITAGGWIAEFVKKSADAEDNTQTGALFAQMFPGVAIFAGFGCLVMMAGFGSATALKILYYKKMNPIADGIKTKPDNLKSVPDKGAIDIEDINLMNL